MAAGADFIKTSTGKVTPAATLPVTLVMLEAIRDFERVTGKVIGMKPAGGIRTAKESIQYLVVLYETLGPRWMTPDLFRFGASSLLNDVLMQIEKERTGALPAAGPLHARLTVGESGLPFLVVAGSHREIGRQLGAATAGTIRRAVDFDAELPAGRTRDEQLALASRYRAATLAATPWLVDEVDGAAEGAGVDPLALFAASIEEIWTVRPSQATLGAIVDGRCSDLVAAPPATADGHVWVAHTNDLAPGSEASVVAIEWRVPGEPVVFSLGIGPWISVGWNSAGLSLTGNELSPNDERVGVPRLLMVREQLTARTIDEAVAMALRPDRASSYNTVFAHRDGRVVNVEGSATDAEVTLPPRPGRSPTPTTTPASACSATRVTRHTRVGPRCDWRGRWSCSTARTAPGPRRHRSRPRRCSPRSRTTRRRPRSAATTTASRPRSRASGALPTSPPA